MCDYLEIAVELCQLSSRLVLPYLLFTDPYIADNC